jgi:hypothetical protein
MLYFCIKSVTVASPILPNCRNAAKVHVFYAVRGLKICYRLNLLFHVMRKMTFNNYVLNAEGKWCHG